MAVLQQCNRCARTLAAGACGESTQETVTIEKEWGYFSRKDTERHRIVLCEDCYDEWIKTFKLPVSVEENRELL